MKISGVLYTTVVMFGVLLSDYTEGLPREVYIFILSAGVNYSYRRKRNEFAEGAKYDPYAT